MLCAGGEPTGSTDIHMQLLWGYCRGDNKIHDPDKSDIDKARESSKRRLRLNPHSRREEQKLEEQVLRWQKISIGDGPLGRFLRHLLRAIV